MKPFYVLFQEKNSSQIEYNGKIINRSLKIDKKGNYTLRFKFISTNSKFIQAIVIFLNNFKGKLIVNNEEYKTFKNKFPKINCFEDTAPKQFDVMVVIEDGSLIICNGSDPLGTKEICHSLSFGCAMIIEKLGENKFKFYCNDHENDDDFDDLVFEMEILD